MTPCLAGWLLFSGRIVCRSGFLTGHVLLVMVAPHPRFHLVPDPATALRAAGTKGAGVHACMV